MGQLNLTAAQSKVGYQKTRHSNVFLFIGKNKSFMYDSSNWGKQCNQEKNDPGEKTPEHVLQLKENGIIFLSCTFTGNPAKALGPIKKTEARIDLPASNNFTRM